jgi:hypothetical protein
VDLYHKAIASRITRPDIDAYQVGT